MGHSLPSPDLKHSQSPWPGRREEMVKTSPRAPPLWPGGAVSPGTLAVSSLDIFPKEMLTQLHKEMCIPRGHKHFQKESKMETLIKHKKETRLEISFYSGRESDQHHSWFRDEYKEETHWQVRNTHQRPNKVSWRPHRAVPSASKRGKGRLDLTFVCPL